MTRVGFFRFPSNDGKGRASASSPVEHRPPRQTILRKYLFTFVSLVTIALLASGLVGSYVSYRQGFASLGQAQREKAASAASSIQGFVTQIQDQLLAANPPGLLADPDSVQQRYSEYRTLLRSARSITDVRYLDSDGREQLFVSRTALDAVGSGRDYSGDPAFQLARPGAPYFGELYYRNGSEPYMRVSVADRGQGGGVSVADVNLQTLWDVISRIRSGEAGYAYVVDSSGRLIAHPELSLVLQRTEWSWLPQVRSALASSAASEQAEPIFAHDAADRGVLTAWAIVAPTGWRVFVEHPVGEALGPLYSSFALTLVTLIAGVALSALASWILARRMVRPIHTLQAGAARIDAGGLEQRIDVRTGDELEALADEFNRMTARLQESYAGLEQKVQERTGELAAALRALETANRHKSEFLANVSHELRTPLNAIIGFSDVLVERMVGGINAKQEEYLNDIRDSGRHLLSLINDILDLSKVEAGKAELDLTEFALLDAIEDGLTMVREQATRRQIGLSRQVTPESLTIQADERKVKQILFNLMSNAVKFTPDGGQVSVLASRVNADVRVAVQDTGIGIAEADQRRVFEEFYQSPDPAAADASGTGLGLPLAKRFVELHGGRIWLESQPGKGSTFTFALPPQVHPQDGALRSTADRVEPPGTKHAPGQVGLG